MRVIRQLSALAGATVTMLPFATPGHAQSTVGAPTREEIERVPVSPLPSAREQNVTIDGEIERAPCPLASDEFKGISVTLASVEFAGAQGISPNLLAPSYASRIGQTVPIAEICTIRDDAATRLRRAGFLAAVQVPPQRIENGAVRFDVLLAKLVDFQVRGNAGRSEGKIASYLAAIREQPVFNILEAERYLLLARDLPGFDVRLTLRPAGTVPGEVIGEVQVVHTPVELEANIQNYGSREVGRFGGLAQMRLNGLLGAGDRTTIGGYATADFEEQRVVQFGQELRIGREGLTFIGDFTYAWTRPDIDPRISLRSRTLVASIEARYPLIRRQVTNLFAGAGLDLINQRTRFNGVPLTRDKLRVAFARLDADIIDSQSLGNAKGYSPAEPRWRVGGGVELRHGIGIFDASEGCGPGLTACAGPGVVPPSRLEADPTAFVARASAFAETRPTPGVTISVAPRAQYSKRPLLSYEEFSAGNFTVGRGYDPGTIIGDSGVAVATELRFGSLIPQSNRATAFQAYGFMDTAWVWNRDRAVPVNDPQRLVSAGAGLRMAYGDRINLDITGAVPLKRAGLQAQRGDARLLVNLSFKLLPGRR